GAIYYVRQVAAGAVVVAHLDCALKTAASSRICRPIQMSLERLAVIVGSVTKEAAIIEFGCPYDLAGIEECLGVEPVLYLFEGAGEARAEHRLVEFPTHKPAAMLAGG